MIDPVDCLYAAFRAVNGGNFNEAIRRLRAYKEWRCEGFDDVTLSYKGEMVSGDVYHALMCLEFLQAVGDALKPMTP